MSLVANQGHLWTNPHITSKSSKLKLSGQKAVGDPHGDRIGRYKYVSRHKHVKYCIRPS